jgi:hypothetical protein
LLHNNYCIVFIVFNPMQGLRAGGSRYRRFHLWLFTLNPAGFNNLKSQRD